MEHEDIDVLLPGSRVGDKGRQRAMEHLETMHAEGYITAEEAERRINHVAASATHREVAGLLSDLPGIPLTRVESFRAASAARKPMTSVQQRIVRSWVANLVFLVLGELTAGLFYQARGTHVAVVVMMVVIAAVAVVWLIINAAWTTEHWNKGS